MKILFLGDVHGNWSPFMDYIEYSSKEFGIEAVIQVGDFGFYPGSIKTLSQALYRHKIDLPIYFIDGNHEDHLYLHEANHAKLSSKYNIHYCPRGSVLDIGGSVFAFLGGALNVDRPQEKIPAKDNENGKLITITNYPVTNDALNLSSKLNLLGKPIDVMVTHACPGGEGVGMKGSQFFEDSVIKYIMLDGFKVYDINDVGEEPLSILFKNMQYKPPLWMFGHYHKHHHAKVGKTDFVCCGCSDCTRDPIFYIYDTEDNTLIKKYF